MDYTKICFVIMPFGKKQVANREVDFDLIYNKVFVPAVESTPLPEGGQLIPKRTDQDFFSSSISMEMFHYIEYSRMAIADISGLNANVFYELGARHRARETGTAIFRQADAPIPFDINQIKAFPYEYEPEENIKIARELIKRVLTESLQMNKLDSPIQQTLLVQQRSQQHIEGFLREADQAIRIQDRLGAIDRFRQAIDLEPRNPLVRLRLGLLLKDEGRWADALGQFLVAIQESPQYAEAWRERGVAENKLYWKHAPPEGPLGDEALKRAIELNPYDFDAMSSLGGVLKRAKKWEEAAAMYHSATEVSHGHPYPLLNEIKLRARLKGELEIDDALRFHLSRAERPLRGQIKIEPPYNAPWSFFDLAEIRLYCSDPQRFLELVGQGLLNCAHSWQAETFRNSLNLLVEGNVNLPGLHEGIKKVTERIRLLPK